MSTDPELRRVGALAARLVENQLRNQAPVKTGKLRSSVAVVPKYFGERVRLDLIFLQYGRFQDLGTGQYRVPPARRRKWNPNPGRGKGGIKPRFWTTLSDAFKNRELFTLFRNAAQKIMISTFRKIAK